MTRTLHANMVTAAQAETGEIFYLLSFAFSAATTYLTTASNDVTWSGNTYLSVGGHLSFEAIQETDDLNAQSVRVVLDGVDQTIITDILGQNHIGRTATIHLVHLTSGGAIESNPYQSFSGVMNGSFKVEETSDRVAGTCRVSTVLSSSLTRLRGRRGIWTNVASHSAVYSGDTFFRFMNGVAQRAGGLLWGGATPLFGGTWEEDRQPGDGRGEDTPFI
jgi:hypothetical protein